MSMDIERKRNQCNIMLKALMGEGHYMEWWNSKNKAFDDRTPEEIWEKESDRVYEYLIGHCLR